MSSLQDTPLHANAGLSLTGKRWQWPATASSTPNSGPNDTVPAWLSGLLTQRGFAAGDALRSYLSPSLAELPDPTSMADMAVGAERLAEAVRKREAIVVYGDYDVDGVCSTAILVEFLRGAGADVDYYIPDRRSEGYGLNPEAVAKICERAGLLVTTDCGITAIDEVALARSRGVDVIIVDHHKVLETLPAAVACLNPQRPDCNFPYKGMCAAGVAFMLVGALRRVLRESNHFSSDRPEPDIRELLDIVALATVADMVPITEVNRILLTAGLKQIARSRRPGLLALLAVSQVEQQRVTATDLGFRIGPRINARGRLEHAAEAVELMLTADVQRAKALADALDTANQERRRIESATVEQAVEIVEGGNLTQLPGLVLYHPDWHPGVLGLVASRLASRYQRPAVVIGNGGKGSGRSIEGLDLYACMDAGSAHCKRFGGHHAAAGLTIDPDNIATFGSAFCTAVEGQLGAPPYVATLRPEMELPVEELNLGMIDDLDRLEPFGQANPAPLFVSRAVAVRSKRLVGGDHLKLTLSEKGHDAIAFRMGHLAEQLPSHVDVAYRLERNEFRGRISLQMRIEDLRPHRLPD